MSEQTILTVQDGKKRLGELEATAKENLHNSREFFSRAVVALDEIRKQRLWVYAVDEDGVMLQDYTRASFKRDYLYHFCRRNGISMSSVYDHLDTVTSAHLIGWDDEKIVEVGVHELKPLTNLVKVDGRSGEVWIAPEEIIEQLPPGDTPLERIAKKAEEVFVDPPEKLSPADALRALTKDLDGTPDVSFFESGNGDVWMVYNSDEHNWDGAIIPAENFRGMSDIARECLVKKLKIDEYTRRD